MAIPIPAVTNQPTTLLIEGMQGEACVQKVTEALGTVPALTVHSVSVGSAVVEGDRSVCNAACIAVDDAGFLCRDASTISVAADQSLKENESNP